ncbi:undecaprenyl-diphosphate phosphatase [Paenibacillus sp. MMS18-CY102]|uniref:undecaprenyl-diphosphate phosphatase n=1 Tax=Paenibacillus sp. MMS18-CY102 TaxID=2682849 RepID=UPI0013654A2B|nr:undecaprenyl-diphosphate phosphatase [Paenibacillus sp. MMS18-CY102]MWC27919.1 undecaprenyl-diphosphate phosphatase [Paenibacillus sp. MMS18-CY102]
MDDLVKAVIMGIVEGLTEFLPISSTGHMIVTGELLNFTGDRAKTFEVVVQLGAVLAVLVLYWKRFMNLLSFNLKKPGLNILHIIIGMFPASVLGLVLHGFIKDYLFGPKTVVVSLIVGGLLLIAAEKIRRKPSAETLDDITYRQALGIGCFQILSLWPGFSRSGSTMAGGMFFGVKKEAAAEFTFLMSVPIMLGASGVDLIKSREFLEWNDTGLFLTGLLASFVVAMIAIVTFLNLLKRISLTWFAYYRFVLAAVVFWVVL